MGPDAFLTLILWKLLSCTFSAFVTITYTESCGHSTSGLVADTKSRTDRLSTKRLTLLRTERLKHKLCAAGGLQ